MLLFQKRFHEGLVNGDVTLTFRRWDKPHVKPGGRYRCHPIGVLEVDTVDTIRAKHVTEEEALRSGFASRDELLSYLSGFGDGPVRPETPLVRVGLHYGGDGDRVGIALDENLTAQDVAKIEAVLTRFDTKQAWTRETLELIRKHPRVAASQLAAKVGRETAPFKADVVKLKKLGLTQSFEVGYEVSPRGRAFLGARGPGVARPSASKRSRGPKSRSTAETTRQTRRVNPP